VARETVNDSGDQVEWTEDQSGVRSEIPSWGNGMCERTESGQFPNSTGKGGRLLPGALSALTGSESEERKREGPATFPNREGPSFAFLPLGPVPLSGSPTLRANYLRCLEWHTVISDVTAPSHGGARVRPPAPVRGSWGTERRPGSVGPLGFRQPQ
jgi:hypothetical protein